MIQCLCIRAPNVTHLTVWFPFCLSILFIFENYIAKNGNIKSGKTLVDVFYQKKSMVLLDLSYLSFVKFELFFLVWQTELHRFSARKSCVCCPGICPKNFENINIIMKKTKKKVTTSGACSIASSDRFSGGRVSVLAPSRRRDAGDVTHMVTCNRRGR